MTENYPELRLFLAGAWVGAEAGRTTREVTNPATGEVLSALPLAEPQDLDAAAEAAAAAFPEWRRTPALQRSRILRRAADVLRSRAAEIGRLTSLEQGKPIAEATSEVHAAAGIFDWFAEEGRRAYGRVVPASRVDRQDLVLREPVGPVLALTPWNFPITIPARKIGAALAAGCTCVIKPAEETPATALALAQACQDAGLPAGVLSMVFGEPAQISERLIGHPAIRKVTFTGSTAVGAEIAGLAARRVIRTSLELGGHAPVLVFEDADLDLVLRTAGAAKFRNAGQVCISPTRFVVHESLHDDLAARLAKHAAGLVVGPGTDPDTTMGPLVHDRRVAAIQSLVDDAVARGGQLLAGGTADEPRGSYYRPTVIAAAAPDSRAMHEEPFGPLALLTPFGSDDEAFDIANSTEYGLAAYAFTDSLRTARRVAAEVQAGMIAINHAQLVGPETPFGGLKQSGYGSDGGAEALDDYLNVKLVSQT